MQEHTSASVQPVPRRTTSITIMAGLLVLVLLSLGLVLTDSTQRTWWSVFVLGTVEGLTEFLPISSTGHLLLTAQLLHFRDDIGGTFEIFIQLGAIFAVIGFYSRDLLAQIRTLTTSAATRRFWLGIFVAFLPAAVIGLALHNWIKRVLFASPSVIAWSFIIGGIVLIVVERLPYRKPTAHDIERVSLAQAFGIGLAQVLALVPGVSRSGSSIVGGMLSGLDRPTATTFSFYLAIPTLGAATVVDLLGSIHQLSAANAGHLVVGTIVSMAVAWVSIGWLLRYVARNSFVLFGIYRIIAGIVVLALVAAGILHA